MSSLDELAVLTGSDRKKLSVVGLGKLGSPMLAVFAHKGFDVIGLDVNPAFVAAINEGRAPVEEPGLQEMIDRNRSRISATTKYNDVACQSDVTFVIVPTPSGTDCFFTNKYVVEAVTKLGLALRGKKGYHLVVVTSTVMPGSTDGEIRAALEASSGRSVGADLGLCYNPEFIALGSVIKDMLHPDMILIGESDRKSGDILERIYAASTDSHPEIHRMNCVNAELTKISVNTYVTTKISYANMIAEMCDHLPGADAHVVSTAIGADSRIGKKYIKGAVGYGGPCFPRDNKAFAALGRRLGVRCDLAEATDRINDHQVSRMVGFVERYLPRHGRIAILGLSYKPNTPVVEASQGVLLADQLAEAGHHVVVFDPVVPASAAAQLAGKVTFVDLADDAILQSDVVVVMTASPEYAKLRGDQFCKDGRRRVVIDPWQILSADVSCSVEDHVIPGRSAIPVESQAGRRSAAA
ncbi:UDP-glucose dehydrogenase family protein [Planktothrix sp.]|uniref:UDP-glucose dehydrogenase family protein n=1 Tax=Planktothrix sp. TaxID=3088171 RepID=UPI0038D4E1FC